MPASYPLQSLLNVRRFRETAAERELSAAQAGLRAAQKLVEEKVKELEAWRSWRSEEIERRYALLLGHPTVVARIMRFNEELAQLNLEELAREEALSDAKLECEKARQTIDAAKRKICEARHNTAKIEKHRSIWSEAMKLEAERAEDLELEEFSKPRMDLGAEGDA